MGLAVEVGMLADLLDNDEEGAEWLRESLANANAVLTELSLPTHSEPESLPTLDDRAERENRTPIARKWTVAWKHGEMGVSSFARDVSPTAEATVGERMNQAISSHRSLVALSRMLRA
jgi:hypothetical protein